MPPGVYSYSSLPSGGQKKKKLHTMNIHCDPRVFRGCTIKTFKTKDDLMTNAYVNEVINDDEGDKVAPRPSYQFTTTSHISPDLDLSSYLEAPIDKPTMKNCAMQSDSLLPCPPKAPFIPPKTGIDNSTQIEDCELFDFDIEVSFTEIEIISTLLIF